ncbi:hypothetical protein ACS0TY_027773 [Phlomoides rotata]
MSLRNHLKRNREFFAYIPSEIIIDILSRLPVRSIISCKCVCKPWLTLLRTHGFVESHRLKAIPGLAVYRFKLNLYKLFEFEDGLDLEHHGLHYKSVTKFNIPAFNGWVSGSANGFLFLCKESIELEQHVLRICNPITREYIELDCTEFVNYWLDVVTYGFGSTNITGQHKVVRIFQQQESIPGFLFRTVPKSDCVCHVYTIGTGVWRRISPFTHVAYSHNCSGAFLNGNLHWSVSDFEGPELWISCFDLETERFSTFSSPLLKTTLSIHPTILGDCLCLCDNSLADGIDIWLMKEYGVEKSWTKQFFIGIPRPLELVYKYDDVISPIRIFKDGDILLALDNEFLYYSKKNDAVLNLLTFEPHDDINQFLYTPSFLSLKSFGTEKKYPRFCIPGDNHIA